MDVNEHVERLSNLMLRHKLSKGEMIWM